MSFERFSEPEAEEIDFIFQGVLGSREMVGTGGFEPPTPRTPSVCATRLRYVPTS